MFLKYYLTKFKNLLKEVEPKLSAVVRTPRMDKCKKRKYIVDIVAEVFYFVFFTILPFFKSSHLRCSIKKLFLKILQYSHKNTGVEASFHTFLFFIRIQVAKDLTLRMAENLSNLLSNRQR